MADDDPDPEAGRGRLHLRPHPGAPCEPWDCRSAASAFGLTAGLISLFLGLAIEAASWLGGRGSYGPLLTKVGTLLLVISLPLLAAGAHCLDLEEARAANGRQARPLSPGAADEGRGE